MSRGLGDVYKRQLLNWQDMGPRRGDGLLVEQDPTRSRMSGRREGHLEKRTVVSRGHGLTILKNK